VDGFGCASRRRLGKTGAYLRRAPQALATVWRTPATAAVALTMRRLRESRGRARVGRRREELGVGFIEEREEEERLAGVLHGHQWRRE
jgi:hypothetical protein